MVDVSPQAHGQSALGRDQVSFEGLTSGYNVVVTHHALHGRKTGALNKHKRTVYASCMVIVIGIVEKR